MIILFSLSAVAESEKSEEKEVQSTETSNLSLKSTSETNEPSRYMRIHAKSNTPESWATGFLDFGEDPFNNVQEMTFKGLFGSQNNKLELYSNEAELSPEGVQYADVDIFYWHKIHKSWAVKGGANYFYRPTDSTPYWQPGMGIEGTAFYNIDTNFRFYSHEGSVKLDAELIRDNKITEKFLVKTSVRSILATSTVSEDEIGSGLNQMRYFVRPYYRLTPELNVFIEYEHVQDYGATASIRDGIDEETTENLVLLGLSADF